jgi:hypothetical protein
MLNMKFIKFTIIYLLFTVSYLAYLLSKLEPLHVHEIGLTFIAIGSMLAGGVRLLGSLKEDKSDIVESNDDTSI